MNFLKNQLTPLIDYLLGYDFFISYAHSDGLNYPSSLAERLSKVGFKVFLDTQIYKPGDDLNQTTKRRVRMSKHLIIVTRKNAMMSKWVLKEIEVAKRVGIPLILVDINNCYESEVVNTPFKLATQSYLRLNENLIDLDGAPTDTTLVSLQSAFKGIRQERFRIRIAFVLILLFATIAGYSIVQTLNLKKRTDEVILERMETEKQKTLAESRGDSLQNQLVISDSLRLSETEQKLIAETNAAMEKEQRKRTEVAFNIANANYLSVKAENVLNEDNTKAIRIGQIAYSLNASNPPNHIRQLLSRLYSSKSQTPFYQEFQNVKSASFSPNNKMLLVLTNNKLARLFSVRGELINSFEKINFAQFSKDGNKILTLTKKNILRIVSINGEVLYEDKHNGNISNPIFSPTEDKVLFYNTEQGDVIIWDYMEDLKYIMNHKEVSSAIFSPDGLKIYSSSSIFSGNSKLWDSEGKLLKVFRFGGKAKFSNDNKMMLKGDILYSSKGDSLTIISADKDEATFDFSPDCSKILSTSWNNGTVRIWSIINGDKVKLIKTHYHEGPVWSGTFSTNGEHFFTISSNKPGAFSWNYKVSLFSIEDGFIKDYKNQTAIDEVTSSTDGNLFFIRPRDGTVKICSREGKEVYVLRHNEAISSGVLSPNRKMFFSISEKKTGKFWKFESDNSLATFEHDDLINSVVFSPNGNNILTASKDNTAKLWTLDGELLSTFNHQNSVTSVVFSNDGNNILTGSEDFLAKLWNPKGDSLMSFKHQEAVVKVAFLLNEKIVTATKNQINLWNSQGDSLNDFFLNGELLDIKPVEKGKRILLKTIDKLTFRTFIKIWNPLDNSFLDIDENNHINLTLDFSSGGERILTRSIVDTSTWEIGVTLLKSDGTFISSLDHDDQINSANFSNDGKLIITSSEDSSAKLWNALNGKLIKVFQHEAGVSSAFFSPDDSKILTSCDDYSAKVWSLKGDLIYVLKHPSEEVVTLFPPVVKSSIFAPDGNTILTISKIENKNVPILWTIDGEILDAYEGNNDFPLKFILEDADGEGVLGGAQYFIPNNVVAKYSDDSKKILIYSESEDYVKLWLTPKGIYEWLLPAFIDNLSAEDRKKYRLPQNLE